MRISGFTMVKNADKYYFPIKESIESILPIVDEFIVALGDNDSGDKTRELIESIQSEKIKIINRVWSKELAKNGEIYAHETNFALSQCTGDWCFYLQADEVVHEKYLDTIKRECENYLNNKQIDGLLFNYNHFFGDYDHYLPFHGWYKNEIRIVRNNSDIHSIKDAQSFRKGNNKKLNVAKIDAYINHYGWVRPPEKMQSKKKEQEIKHYGKDKTATEANRNSNDFNYGALGKIPIFKDTHPKVMANFISNISWKHKLNYGKKTKLNRDKMKHERFKYRFISRLENLFNNNYIFGGYSNWNIIKDK